MFGRLQALFAARASVANADDMLAQWAHTRLLSHLRQPGGGFALGGRLLDRPFRAECATTGRVYMEGLELKAKADLGLTAEVNVVLMNRSLKRRLESLAHEMYGERTDRLQTKDRRALPEEVRWLSMYRDAGWPGPEDSFWGRYAVLTDAPETARQWLEAESLASLMEWPAEPGWDAPRLFMLMRGKAYLRMQVGQAGDHSAALHALDIFEQLSGRAIQLLER